MTKTGTLLPATSRLANGVIHGGSPAPCATLPLPCLLLGEREAAFVHLKGAVVLGRAGPRRHRDVIHSYAPQKAIPKGLKDHLQDRWQKLLQS